MLWQSRGYYKYLIIEKNFVLYNLWLPLDDDMRPIFKYNNKKSNGGKSSRQKKILPPKSMEDCLILITSKGILNYCMKTSNFIRVSYNL